MAPVDPSRPLLVLDAASATASVAVLLPDASGGTRAITRAVTMGAGAADGLFPAMQAVLAEGALAPRDLAAVICGEGPGSFTSLRIAAALAKGLAHGLDVPLYAVSSLALIAASLPAEGPSGPLLVHADALRGERFVTEVVREASGVISAVGVMTRVSVDDLRARGNVPLVSVGGAPPGVPSHTVLAVDAGRVLLIEGKWRAAPVERSGWEPLYGRLAEAQVKWEADRGQPLPDLPPQGPPAPGAHEGRGA